MMQGKQTVLPLLLCVAAIFLSGCLGSDTVKEADDRVFVSDDRVFVSSLPDGFTYMQKIDMSAEQLKAIVPQMEHFNVPVSCAKYAYSKANDSGLLYFAAADTKTAAGLKTALIAAESMTASGDVPLTSTNIDGSKVYQMIVPILDSNDGNENEPAEFDIMNTFVKTPNIRINIWANGSTMFMTIGTIENESALTEFIRSSGTL